MTIFTPQLASTWDLDVWGKVRRRSRATPRRLRRALPISTTPSFRRRRSLPLAYFNLRAADSLRALLERTVVEDKETLRITQDKFNAGFCPSPGGSNCVSEAELRSAQALVLTPNRRRSMSACNARNSNMRSPC